MSVRPPVTAETVLKPLMYTKPPKSAGTRLPTNHRPIRSSRSLARSLRGGYTFGVEPLGRPTRWKSLAGQGVDRYGATYPAEMGEWERLKPPILDYGKEKSTVSF